MISRPYSSDINKYAPTEELWAFCTALVEDRVCAKRCGGEARSHAGCPGRLARERLLDAFDEVADPMIFIRKVDPDPLAFVEANMKPQQLYQL